MACFSKDSGAWGDCCVAVLGFVCLMAAVIASGMTMAQWHHNQAYRWTHCAFSYVDNSSSVNCQMCPVSTLAAAGSAEICMNQTYTCIRIIVQYKDGSGKDRIGVIHPDISNSQEILSDQPQCSLDVCVGIYPENLQAAFEFSTKMQSMHSYFQCFYNSDHFGQIFLQRPGPCRFIEVLLISVMVVFVICVLTLIVRCRFVYLNAKEARSCSPSMTFFIMSSLRSSRSALWTLAYKAFDWKLNTAQAQLNSDTQGLVEPYREERDDVTEQQPDDGLAVPITVYIEPSSFPPEEESLAGVQ